MRYLYLLLLSLVVLLPGCFLFDRTEVEVESMIRSLQDIQIVYTHMDHRTSMVRMGWEVTDEIGAVVWTGEMEFSLKEFMARSKEDLIPEIIKDAKACIASTQEIKRCQRM